VGFLLFCAMPLSTRLHFDLPSICTPATGLTNTSDSRCINPVVAEYSTRVSNILLKRLKAPSLMNSLNRSPNPTVATTPGFVLW